MRGDGPVSAWREFIIICSTDSGVVDGGRARRGKVRLPPLQFWGPEYYPLEICEDMGSNLCNLVHFGV